MKKIDHLLQLFRCQKLTLKLRFPDQMEYGLMSRIFIVPERLMREIRSTA